MTLPDTSGGDFGRFETFQGEISLQRAMQRGVQGGE